MPIMETWRGWRDRLLSNPRFVRWASAFPLTRPVARQRARALFDLCAGFVYSQVLFAAVQVRLLDHLADGPKSLEVLAEEMDLPVERAARLINAAASLDLVEPRANRRFGLGSLGAAFLGNPGVRAMVDHHRMLYADLQDPKALLQSQGMETALGQYWPYAGNTRPDQVDGGQVAAYSDLMSASQMLIGESVVSAYPLRRHTRLMDLGGGDGTFLSTAAAKAPSLDLVLFDLPAVADHARTRLAARGLANRVEAVGGDFLKDPLPPGADVISLIRVIHDHSDEDALRILQSARTALPPDGVLLLAEPMAQTRGAESVGAYFEFYLLAMGAGRPRTHQELKGLLQSAGFTRLRSIKTHMPLLARLMVASP